MRLCKTLMMRSRCLLLLLGGLNRLIYWGLKHATRRLRPFESCPGIRACARAADVFSFPSGRTLHAAAFALLLSSHYPTLAPLLWAFALAGALIGTGTATTLAVLVP